MRSFSRTLFIALLNDCVSEINFAASDVNFSFNCFVWCYTICVFFFDDFLRGLTLPMWCKLVRPKHFTCHVCTIQSKLLKPALHYYNIFRRNPFFFSPTLTEIFYITITKLLRLQSHPTMLQAHVKEEKKTMFHSSYLSQHRGAIDKTESVSKSHN